MNIQASVIKIEKLGLIFPFWGEWFLLIRLSLEEGEIYCYFLGKNSQKVASSYSS